MTCDALASEGESCTMNLCHPGLACDTSAGVCVDAPDEGQACGVLPGPECANCLECDGSSGTPTCRTPAPGPGESCGSRSTCETGSWCKSGTCSEDPIVCLGYDEPPDLHLRTSLCIAA